MLEAWQLRERQGGEGALNPRHKKKEIYHFTSASGGGGAPSMHGGQVLS